MDTSTKNDSRSLWMRTENGGKQPFVDLAPLLEARIFAYDILRRIFLREPSQDILMDCEKCGMTMVFPFREENEDIAQGTRLVQSYLQQNGTLMQHGYDRLQADYMRLFVGPGEVKAPPWESVYLNKDKLLFQEETRRVRLKYLKYAFLPALYQQEADDHVGLECDFMYHLSVMAYEKFRTQEFEEFNDILFDQEDFLEQHLQRWIPLFTEKVAAYSDTEFYQGMAMVLRGFLQLDRQALREMAELAR